MRIFEQPDPWPYVNVGIDVDIPSADEIIPKVGVVNFRGVQPYKLVMVGEKSSLDVVLGPIAKAYQADLYLPTGDISDTMIYNIAKVAAEDGRPIVILYFADADPSGWSMGVVIARNYKRSKFCTRPARLPSAPRGAHTRPGARVRVAIHAAQGNRETRRQGA